MKAYSSANSSAPSARKSDKWIPLYFVLFFVVIAAIDITFVTIAVRTQTGVVTEKAYEKGLAYNNFISEADRQSHLGITQKSSFKDGIIIWKLTGANGEPLEGVNATARIFRPSHEGYDFHVQLMPQGKGIYEARPSFPLPGIWTAKLEAVWQNSQSQPMSYGATMEFIAP